VVNSYYSILLTESHSQSDFTGRLEVGSCRPISRLSMSRSRSRAYSMVTARFSTINWGASRSPADPATTNQCVHEYSDHMNSKVKAHQHHHHYHDHHRQGIIITHQKSGWNAARAQRKGTQRMRIPCTRHPVVTSTHPSLPLQGMKVLTSYLMSGILVRYYCIVSGSCFNRNIIIIITRCVINLISCGWKVAIAA